MGTPFRAATIAAGAAMAAEADGAHAIWYPGPGPGVATHPGVGAGPDASQVPVGDGAGLDATDAADPIITASVALLVARRVRVGILGWDFGGDAERAARAAATLADLAPGRVMLACAGADSSLVALAVALRADLDLELAVYGATPGTATGNGWGWIGVGCSPESLAKVAGDAGVVGPIGIHLPVFVHQDGDLASRGASSALVDGQVVDGQVVNGQAVDGDGAVIGTGAALDAAIDEYVGAGVTRIVIDNRLPYAVPEALESSQAVIRASIRIARIRHRETQA